MTKSIRNNKKIAKPQHSIFLSFDKDKLITVFHLLGTELQMGAKTPGKLLGKWHFEINKDPIEAQPRHIMSTLDSYQGLFRNSIHTCKGGK